MKSRTVAFVCSAPWYTDELRLMKAACRKLERRWRLSGLSVHNQAWKEHLHEYKAENNICQVPVFFSNNC